MVAVDNDFPHSGYDLASQERVSAQDLGVWSDVARECLAPVKVVPGDVFEDLHYLGNRAARPFEFDPMPYIAQVSHLLRRRSRIRHGPQRQRPDGDR